MNVSLRRPGLPCRFNHLREEGRHAPDRRTKQRPVYLTAVAAILAVAITASFAAEVTTPTVETGRATNVEATSATLNSIVSANGAETGAAFEYGRNPTYGSSIGSLAGSGNTQGTYDFRLTIRGLTHYRAVAGNSAEASYAEDRIFVAGNNSSIAQNDHFDLGPGPFPLRVLANDSDADHNPLRVTQVTQPTHGAVAIADGGTEISYLLTDASHVGDDPLTYVVSDGVTTDSANVVIHVPRESILRVIFKKGDPVPGAGILGSSVPAGATFERFGLPSINDAGSISFRAQITSSEGGRAVVFGPKPDAASAVRVSDGENAPAGDGTPTGLTFASFKHPLLNDVGAIALLAELSGEGVNASNDAGIWTNESGALQMVAREGDAAPGVPGAVFAHFVSVALGDGAYAIDEDNVAPPGIAFVAQLEVGRGGVTAANDLGLWIYKRGQAPLVRLLLREGAPLQFRTNDTFPGKTVLSFIALQPMSGTAGQGHGVGFNHHSWAHDEVLARVKFTDSTQAIAEFRIGPDFSVHAVAQTAESTNPAVKYRSFRVPTQSFDGQNAFISPEETRRGLYVANDLDAQNVYHIVSEGDPLPENNQASFASLQNVVNNGHGSYAFLATVAGTGITTTNDLGIWRNSIDGIVPLVREGSPAPGVDNQIFSKFLSLAMPDNGRAIVKATVRDESTLARSHGIWFTAEGYDGNANVLKLLIREGDFIPGVTGGPLQSFNALEYVSGSPMQTRSFNNVGEFICRGTFADGSQALLRAELP